MMSKALITAVAAVATLSSTAVSAKNPHSGGQGNQGAQNAEGRGRGNQAAQPFEGRERGNTGAQPFGESGRGNTGARPFEGRQPGNTGAQPFAEGTRGSPASQGRNACFAGEDRGDCRERLRVQRRTNSTYVWRNGRYEASSGAATSGNIIGFAHGAPLVGSSSDRDYVNSHKNDRSWRTRCQRTYRSFNWRTGTYLGLDGSRHYCTS